MTTLELFKKHRKGEVSRERFLYEVRRDNNLPWITNTTSYNDAVKILKNKGIIREAQFEPQNITTDPAVDRANPYALKREVQKLLSKEKELTNDSYKLALNKAAKKIAGNPQAIKDAMFSNSDSVAKADSKLQTKEVKKNNFVDKDNGMKKVKGQEAHKAMSAPTKENRKGKPKGVKVMPDKGVTGSQKIIKEVAQYIKKKLSENSLYHEFHTGMEVETSQGPGKVKEVKGGTLEIELKNGKVIDEQMNTVKHFMEKKNEVSEIEDSYGDSEELNPNADEQIQKGSIVEYDNEFGEVVEMSELSGVATVRFDNGDEAYIHIDDLRLVDVDEEDDWEEDEEDPYEEESANQTDFQNGDRIKIISGEYAGNTGEIHDIHSDGTAMVLLGPRKEPKDVDLSHVRKLRPDELEESGIEFKIPGASSPTYTSSGEAASKEAELRRANIRFTKKSVG